MPYLEFRNGQYHARLERGGARTPLHTSDRKLAELRLHDLATGAAPEPTPGAETLREASIRIVAALERDGMRTASERLSRLRRYVWPTLGAIPVDQIKSLQISNVLDAAAKTGLGQVTVDHLQVDLCKVFAELIRDQVLTTNPASARLVRVPKIPRDKRRRVLLTDAEFEQFIGCQEAPLVIRTMGVVSRCFGGLRPSDLYAWEWEDIDLAAWQWADAPRPKTEHHDKEERARERIELPELVAEWIRDWWIEQGEPGTGPVFPNRIQNLARELRRALRTAGLERPELFTATERTLRTDFYSFRRAFVTAVARAGVNAQVGMRLAGHRSMTTHQRYHVPESLQIPEAALPATPELDFDAALEAWQPEGEQEADPIAAE